MQDQRNILLLVVIAFVNMFFHVTAFAPDLMEARNFVTAKEMLDYGNWWETTMNGLPRLEKPPLPTWITAIFGSLSSSFPLWLLRLPAAIMGVLLVVWTYLLAKSLFKQENKALWAGLVAATSLLIMQMARTGSWDIYFTSFAIGSFVFLHRGIEKENNAYLDFIIGGVLMGCSILSKGPVGGIMLVGFSAGLLAVKGYRPFLTHWKEIAIAGLLLAVIGFTWPVYNILHQPLATEAVVEKESITWTTKHVKPFYFYIIFPLYVGIWALFGVMSLIPPLAKKWVGNNYKALLIWLGVTVVLLSLLPMKKERYLLPAMPVMALLIGGFIGDLFNEKSKTTKRIFWIGLGIVGIGLLLSPIAVFIISQKLSYAVSLLSWVGVALLCLCGAALLVNLWKSKFKASAQLTCVSVIVVCSFLMPTLAEVHHKHPNFKSPYELMQINDLQGKDIYFIGEPDMRVVHSTRSILRPYKKETPKTITKEIVVLTLQAPNFFLKKHAENNVQFVDSSGLHRNTIDYKLYAYIMHPNNN